MSTPPDTLYKIEITPEMIEAEIVMASEWLEENRGAIEEGGDGNLRALIQMLLDPKVGLLRS